MDQQQFDALTRMFARGVDRRSLFRGIVGGALAIALGRRQAFPAVMTVAADGLACSETNSPDIACEQINAYVAACGVTCADGTVKKNHGGCTYVPPVETTGGRYRLRVRRKRVRGKPDEYCASASLTLEWVPQGEPQVTMLNLTPPEDACCQDACAAEYRRALKELAEHEAGHVKNWTDAVAKANETWRRRTIEVCKPSKEEAQTAWQARLQELTKETEQSIIDAKAKEPPQANPITCDACAPAGPNQTCCKGTCVSCPDGTQPDPETCQCRCPAETVAAFGASGVALCCPETATVCNDQCCDGACTDNGECCPAPRKVCGATCCASGQACCEATGQCGPANAPCGDPCTPYGEGYHNCPIDDDTPWCCPPECTCCPGKATCICHPDQLCCPVGSSQCYDTCCNNATEVCAGNTEIGGFCCPEGHGFNKDTLQCCGYGEDSVFCTNGPEACCPVNHPRPCECCGDCF